MGQDSSKLHAEGFAGLQRPFSLAKFKVINRHDRVMANVIKLRFCEACAVPSNKQWS